MKREKEMKIEKIQFRLNDGLSATCYIRGFKSISLVKKVLKESGVREIGCWDYYQKGICGNYQPISAINKEFINNLRKFYFSLVPLFEADKNKQFKKLKKAIDKYGA